MPDLAHWLPLVLGAPILWALWKAGRPKPLFTVRIQGERLQVVEGTVTPAFLERVREVADMNGVALGEVRGYPRGSLIRLWFSSSFPAGGRQQLRNWWASCGWPAPGADRERPLRYRG